MVVSNVSRKKRGCRSTHGSFSLMHEIRFSTCSRRMSKSWYCCRENWGRSISRECFQAAPSCVNMPSPSKGKKIWRRRPYPNSVPDLVDSRLPIIYHLDQLPYHQIASKTSLADSVARLSRMPLSQGTLAPGYCRRLESETRTAPLSDCSYRRRRFAGGGRHPMAIHYGAGELEDNHASQSKPCLSDECQRLMDEWRIHCENADKAVYD